MDTTTTTIPNEKIALRINKLQQQQQQQQQAQRRSQRMPPSHPSHHSESLLRWLKKAYSTNILNTETILIISELVPPLYSHL